MADPLERLRELSATPIDAIRWACILEATAPKVGNVYPGRSFDDLSYIDFVHAAEIACRQLTAEDESMSQRMFNAVQWTKNKVGTNVNLGIVLLLGPLVAADVDRGNEVVGNKVSDPEASVSPKDSLSLQQIRAFRSGEGRLEKPSLAAIRHGGPWSASEPPASGRVIQPAHATTFISRTLFDDWLPAIENFLGSLTENDGQNIFRAIAAASPGGLGQVESNDVCTTIGPVNIIEAMKQAADRDRIARQYATGFADLVQNVLPVVESAISQCGDVLRGISTAHLRLLASAPDSLIARKCGIDFAVQVRDRAAQIDIVDDAAVERFDQWLRKDGRRRNPGTTADLIAASLYLILRSSE